MSMIEANLPDDFYSLLVTGAVIVIVIWLAVFIVRKLIGIALIAGLVLGAWLIWNDPEILRSGSETILQYIEQWRGGDAHANPRWS